MNYEFNDETVDLELYFHGESDRAILVSEDGNRLKAQWVPRSQITSMPDSPEPGTVIEVTMSEWIAEQKGLV